MEESVLPSNSSEDRFLEIIHNAFWNHLKEQISSTPLNFTCARDLKEIKEILLFLLLLCQNYIRNEIEETLDMDLLKQEAEHEALDVPHFSNYILNLMTLLCV